MGLILCLIGLFLFIFRSASEHFRDEEIGIEDKLILPLRSQAGGQKLSQFRAFPTVSLIVPARNEEHRIRPLLQSVQFFDPSGFEIIVVDDSSTDQTAEVVKSFERPHIKYFAADPCPPGWVGKSWACHQGASQATGDFLLFTDADTLHIEAKILAALQFMEKNKIALLTSIPCHITKTWWEKLLGPFHVLMLAIAHGLESKIYSQPTPYVYAIGQFLLFEKSAYLKIGGHQAVRDSAAEDLSLAQLVLSHHMNYAVEGKMPLYKVRMYSSFKEFFKGWERLQSIGLRHSPVSLRLESVFIQCGWFCFFLGFQYPVLFYVSLVMVFYIARLQNRIGNFSWLGALLFPINQLLFIAITARSLYGLFKNQGEIQWRGRRLKV